MTCERCGQQVQPGVVHVPSRPYGSEDYSSCRWIVRAEFERLVKAGKIK